MTISQPPQRAAKPAQAIGSSAGVGRRRVRAMFTKFAAPRLFRRFRFNINTTTFLLAIGLVNAAVVVGPLARAQSTPPNPPPISDPDNSGTAGGATPELGEVVVSATRTERKVGDVPASVSVIDSGYIDNRGVQDIRELTAEEPDVSVQRGTGGNGQGRNTRPGFGGYNIRGIDGNRVLIQVDGVRQPDQFTFGGQANAGRDYVDLDSLKRVEIVKGGASSLYGSDAIGGVVSYSTKDPGDFLRPGGRPFAFSLKASYDSAFDARSETAAVAFRVGPMEGLILYTRRDGTEPDTRGNFPADPLNFDTNNVLGKFVFHLSPRQTLTLTGEYFDRRQTTDVLSSRRDVPSPGVLFRVDNLTIEDRTVRGRGSVAYQFVDTSAAPPSPAAKDGKDKNAVAASAPTPDLYARGITGLFFQQLDAQFYYQPSNLAESSAENRRRILPTLQDRVRRRDSDFEQYELGGSLQLQSRFRTGPLAHRLIYGVDVSDTSTERRRNGLEFNLTTGTATNFINPDTFPLKDLPDSDNLRLGFFVQDEIEVGAGRRLLLVPGVRLDYHRITTDPDALYLRASGGIRPTDFDDLAVSPKLGFVGRLTRELSIFGQYTQGFRSPTPEDLNGTVTNLLQNYVTLPNPNLKAEYSYGGELGLRGAFPALSFSLSGYYTYYTDFIDTFQQVGGAFTAADPGIFQSRNLPRAEIYGVEGKADFHVGALVRPLDGLHLLLAAGYSIGNDLANDVPLDSIDPFKLIGTVRYARPTFGVDLITTYVARKDRYPGPTGGVNQFIPDSFVTLDLVGYWKFSRYGKISAGVFNMTNEKYTLYQDVRDLAANRTDIDRFTQPGVNGRVSVTLEF